MSVFCTVSLYGVIANKRNGVEQCCLCRTSPSSAWFVVLLLPDLPIVLFSPILIRLGPCTRAYTHPDLQPSLRLKRLHNNQPMQIADPYHSRGEDGEASRRAWARRIWFLCGYSCPACAYNQNEAGSSDRVTCRNPIMCGGGWVVEYTQTWLQPAKRKFIARATHHQNWLTLQAVQLEICTP